VDEYANKRNSGVDDDSESAEDLKPKRLRKKRRLESEEDEEMDEAGPDVEEQVPYATNIKSVNLLRDHNTA
jgi:hypothetical protein